MSRYTVAASPSVSLGDDARITADARADADGETTVVVHFTGPDYRPAGSLYLTPSAASRLAVALAEAVAEPVGRVAS